MARPSKGDDARKTVSVRLHPRVIEVIDGKAKAAGQTRSAYLERKLTATFVPPDPRPLIDVLAEEAVVLPPKVADVPACAHPKKKLKVHGYGTWCGECGVRLR